MSGIIGIIAACYFMIHSTVLMISSYHKWDVWEYWDNRNLAGKICNIIFIPLIVLPLLIYRRKR